MMDDRELLKQEIKTEIMEELNADRSMKQVPGLKKVKEKWFFGPDKNFKYSDSVMSKMFGSYNQHKVWESVRHLTRIVFGATYQPELTRLDQDKIEYVADRLCTLICELRKEIKAKGEERNDKEDVLPAPRG